MITDIIRLGDKIDIRLIQQIEHVDKTGVSPHIYKSSVNDFLENGDMEITMPIENGKVVLLPIGVRFEFMFYTHSGLYRGIGQVKERYKKNNIYALLIELRSQLAKFQRREFYRYPCVVDMQYYNISKEDALKENLDEIFGKLRDDYFYEKQKAGSIVDLSGGGIRFISEEMNEPDSYILVILRLCNEKIDDQYSIAGHIIESIPLKNAPEKYQNRVQFVIHDNRVREDIIKYIFEEERKARNKKKG